MELKRITKDRSAGLLKSQGGFSLVEILVWLALSTIVIAGFYATYQFQHRAYHEQEQTTRIQQNLRAAMYYLGREIRMAGLDPGGEAGAGITASNSGTLSFSQDLNGDGDFVQGPGDPNPGQPDTNETVTYTLNTTDNEIQRNVSGNTYALVSNITALNFVYLDDSGAVTTTSADVRSVVVTITATADRTYKYAAPLSRTLREIVRCRNI